RPQNRCGFSDSEARTTRPSAVTTVYASTLSQLSPNCRASQPIPPPSVSPPTPVCETLPAVVARPCSPAATSRFLSSEPPPTHALRCAGSARTADMGERSIMTPPSGTDSPSTLWPPHFTAISRPASRAKRTAATTSREEAQRRMAAGRRSTMPFHTARFRSYASFPGRMSSPPKFGIRVMVGIWAPPCRNWIPTGDLLPLMTGDGPLTHRSRLFLGTDEFPVRAESYLQDSISTEGA